MKGRGFGPYLLTSREQSLVGSKADALRGRANPGGLPLVYRRTHKALLTSQGIDLGLGVVNPRTDTVESPEEIVRGTPVIAEFGAV